MKTALLFFKKPLKSSYEGLQRMRITARKVVIPKEVFVLFCVMYRQSNCVGVEECMCLWGSWEHIFQKIKLKDQSPSEAFNGVST